MVFNNLILHLDSLGAQAISHSNSDCVKQIIKSDSIKDCVPDFLDTLFITTVIYILLKMFTSTTSNNNANAFNDSTRAPPSVNGHLDRSPRRPSSSTLERKLQQAEKRMENYESLLAIMRVELDECKARNSRKPAEKKCDFPGSKNEKEQIRVSINAHYLNDSSL